MTRHLAPLFVLCAAAIFAGCSTYTPPAGRADFSALASRDINAGFAARPTAVMPVALAWVRVQAPDYKSYSTRDRGGLYGHGRYAVFTTREVEGAAELGRVQALPDVAGLVSLNRLLLPARLDSDEELRTAAARLKAEMLVLYTFDTTFFESDRSAPLTLITLGSAPTRKVRLHTTVSALVLDTRTGFVYAAFEASEERALDSSLWKRAENLDEARLDAERTAFRNLVEEFEKNWPWIVERSKQGA